MSSNIECTVYTEYMDNNCMWVCEQASTIAGRVASPHMDSLTKKIRPRFAGLLCMGTEKVSYPFSWGQRGFPLRVSKEVEFCFTGEERADKASYISLEELRIKRVELLVINEEICPRLSNDLEHLIDAFPESDREAKYRRMVFWFH